MYHVCKQFEVHQILEVLISITRLVSVLVVIGLVSVFIVLCQMVVVVYPLRHSIYGSVVSKLGP